MCRAGLRLFNEVLWFPLVRGTRNEQQHQERFPSCSLNRSPTFCQVRSAVWWECPQIKLLVSCANSRLGKRLIIVLLWLLSSGILLWWLILFNSLRVSACSYCQMTVACVSDFIALGKTAGFALLSGQRFLCCFFLQNGSDMLMNTHLVPPLWKSQGRRHVGKHAAMGVSPL